MKVGFEFLIAAVVKSKFCHFQKSTKAKKCYTKQHPLTALCFSLNFLCSFWDLFLFIFIWYRIPLSLIRSVYVWNSFLETWILTLTSFPPQAFKLMKWLSRQWCATVLLRLEVRQMLGYKNFLLKKLLKF